MTELTDRERFVCERLASYWLQSRFGMTLAQISDDRETRKAMEELIAAGMVRLVRAGEPSEGSPATLTWDTYRLTTEGEARFLPAATAESSRNTAIGWLTILTFGGLFLACIAYTDSTPDPYDGNMVGAVFISMGAVILIAVGILVGWLFDPK